MADGLNDPYSNRPESKRVLKSRSALSKYNPDDKNSVDFDEIPSVKLREDIQIIQK